MPAEEVLIARRFRFYAKGKTAVGAVILVERQADLPEVIRAGRTIGCTAGAHDGGKGESEQNGNDGEDHQQLEEREEEVETLRREAVQLRKDREEVRGRVEKMLRQIDTIGEQAAS